METLSFNGVFRNSMSGLARTDLGEDEVASKATVVVRAAERIFVEATLDDVMRLALAVQ